MVSRELEKSCPFSSGISPANKMAVLYQRGLCLISPEILKKAHNAENSFSSWHNIFSGFQPVSEEKQTDDESCQQLFLLSVSNKINITFCITFHKTNRSCPE